MSVATATAPISFSCTHCAMELTVPAELSGVAGPCPNCGEMIQSPAPLVEPDSVDLGMEINVLAPTESKSKVPPRKLPPRPRSMKAKPQNPVIEEAMGPLMESTVTPRVSANRGHGRAIHPVVGLSSKYEDDREQGSVIRVALAVLLTLGVVIAVTIFMTNQ